MQGVARQTMNTDEGLFAAVLGPLLNPGYRLACAMLPDPQAAEDVVQNASLIAWRKLGRLQEPDRVRAWFLGIVANECRNTGRRRWSRSVRLGLPPIHAVSSGEEQSVARADLREALHRLSYEDRLAVSLYFYLDMPLAEVAAVAGKSLDATRKRLYRAIRRLRPDLEIEESLR